MYIQAVKVVIIGPGNHGSLLTANILLVSTPGDGSRRLTACCAVVTHRDEKGPVRFGLSDSLVAFFCLFRR